MRTCTGGMAVWFVAAVVAAPGSGCERTPEARVSDYCDVWCTCLARLPAQRDACVTACERELSPDTPQLTDACVDCVESISCSPTWRDDVQVACYSECGGGD